MKMHNPIERGTSYPRCSRPLSVVPNMVKTNTNVSRSSTPKAWATLMFCAGVVIPNPPRTSAGVNPYSSAAPKIPGKDRWRIACESVILTQFGLFGEDDECNLLLLDIHCFGKGFKMASRFATFSKDGILTINEAAAPTNTKKETKFGLSVFTGQ